MAMEFLEGQELRTMIASRAAAAGRRRRWTSSRRWPTACAYAHERDIVHRDIKPANIMVVRDGLVKITDFGIARMRTNEVKTMTGLILGSPKYMSPEQVIGQARRSPRRDIFSLGVVLYEMLTGVAPFDGDNVHGIMYATVNFTPPPPEHAQSRRCRRCST